MLEYQFPADGSWAYVPRVQIVETDGQSGLTVTRMEFTVPGFGRIPACAAQKRVNPGERRDLLWVGPYGDFEFSIGQSGARAAEGLASVKLTYVDDNGRTGTLNAESAVVPGTWPDVDEFIDIRDGCTIAF